MAYGWSGYGIMFVKEGGFLSPGPIKRLLCGSTGEPLAFDTFESAQAAASRMGTPRDQRLEPVRLKEFDMGPASGSSGALGWLFKRNRSGSPAHLALPEYRLAPRNK